MEAIAAAPSFGLGDPGALRGYLARPVLGEQERLKVATEQFEATFLRQFLEKSLEPMIDGALPESEGAAGSIQRYLMSDAIAQSLARRGGFGFATALQGQVRPYAAPDFNSTLDKANP